MRGFLVIYEKAESNWSAYSPDVPGCVAIGDTRDDAAKNFAEALAFHLEGMKEDGLPMPEPIAEADRLPMAV